VDDYINDVEPEWEAAAKTAVFRRREVPIVDLERAKRRPLDLDDLDLSMAGQTMTKGPIVLDDDYSVIDGMHRLADAVVAGERSVQAYVRVQ
jgi:hypothetical protein